MQNTPKSYSGYDLMAPEQYNETSARFVLSMATFSLSKISMAATALTFALIASAQASPTDKTAQKTTVPGGVSGGSPAALMESSTEDPVKSWTETTAPSGCSQSFFNRLKWDTFPLGAGYEIRTGTIFGRWVAGAQIMHNGKIALNEYTPPAEYITIVDPITGAPYAKPKAIDANNDGILEIALLHEKLNDSHYHMCTIYALEAGGPKLIWKSGGKLGNWLNEANMPGKGGALWKGKTIKDAE